MREVPRDDPSQSAYRECPVIGDTLSDHRRLVERPDEDQGRGADGFDFGQDVRQLP